MQPAFTLNRLVDLQTNWNESKRGIFNTRKKALEAKQRKEKRILEKEEKKRIKETQEFEDPLVKQAFLEVEMEGEKEKLRQANLKKTKQAKKAEEV